MIGSRNAWRKLHMRGIVSRRKSVSPPIGVLSWRNNVNWGKRNIQIIVKNQKGNIKISVMKKREMN